MASSNVGPAILTPALVRSAFDLVRPLIERVLASDATNRDFLVAVVAAMPSIHRSSATDDFEASTLLVAEIGDTAAMEPRFRRMAISKAERSVRSGRATADLPPHYFHHGDTTSWGSVILDDIVVACCGVQSFNDEMFAMWIAAAIKSEAKRVFESKYAGQRFV